MKFKELFDKIILTEEHIRKTLKIFYEINLKLIKPEGENPEENNQAAQPAGTTLPAQPAQPAQPAPATPAEPATVVPPPEQPGVEQQSAEQSNENSANENGDNSSAPPQLDASILPSVVTEDEVSETTKEKIVRKFTGEVDLTENQKDNIQCFDDLIDALKNHKKDGEDVLDDFSVEIINLCAIQKFDEIKKKLDKKSKIYVEIYYGYKKDDSIGVKFNKRENSDTLTSTMLVDNEIISAKFSIDKINQKIAEFRNYEVKK